MLVVLFILYALILIGLAIGLTVRRRGRRMIVSIILVLYAIFAYPPLVAPIGEWKGLDGTASLMLAHFLLLIGGLLLFVASFATEKEAKKVENL